MCNRNVKTSKEYKYFQNYLNSFLALCQSNLFGQATESLPSIYTSGKISLSFLSSHSFSLSTTPPPKKGERKGKRKALPDNCTGPNVQGFHTEWWLPLSPAFVHLLWEEQFTESIIDFCHNRYRDASLSLLSQLTLCITTVRPVCEARHYFFSSKSITGVGEKWWK